MTCPNCAKVLPDSAFFCNACGTRVHNTGTAPQPPEAAPPSAVPPAQAAQPTSGAVPRQPQGFALNQNDPPQAQGYAPQPVAYIPPAPQPPFPYPEQSPTTVRKLMGVLFLLYGLSRLARHALSFVSNNEAYLRLLGGDEATPYFWMRNGAVILAVGAAMLIACGILLLRNRNAVAMAWLSAGLMAGGLLVQFYSSYLLAQAQRDSVYYLTIALPYLVDVLLPALTARFLQKQNPAPAAPEYPAPPPFTQPPPYSPET